MLRCVRGEVQDLRSFDRMPQWLPRLISAPASLRLMIISRKSFLLLPPLFFLYPSFRIHIQAQVWDRRGSYSYGISRLHWATLPSLFDPSPRSYLVQRYRVIQVGRQAGRYTLHVSESDRTRGEGRGGGLVTFDSWCKSSDVIKSDCKMYRPHGIGLYTYLTRIFVRRRGVMHVC